MLEFTPFYNELAEVVTMHIISLVLLEGEEQTYQYLPTGFYERCAEAVETHFSELSYEQRLGLWLTVCLQLATFGVQQFKRRIEGEELNDPFIPNLNFN